MNFVEIANDLRSMLEATEDGELCDFAAHFDKIEGQFNAKHDAIRALIDGFKGRADIRQAKAVRLESLAKSDLAKAESLKAYLQYCLKAAGLAYVETDDYKTQVVNNSQPKVVIASDAPPLPEEYTIETVEVLPNKGKLARDWAAGKPLPAGVTVERGQHLRLK